MILQRIHITGGPGSGKTTLAHQAADCLHAPCFELDGVGYVGGAGADRPLEARLADIQRIVEQPAWVTEGVFLGWTGALFEAADCIVWLDLPWRLAAWRILTRHVRAELRGNNKHSGWLKLYRFLRWCQTYYTGMDIAQNVTPEQDISENRVTLAAYLARYPAKVVRCQTPAAVSAFYRNLVSRQLS